MGDLMIPISLKHVLGVVYIFDLCLEGLKYVSGVETKIEILELIVGFSCSGATD